jgi:hypothetical protein
MISDEDKSFALRLLEKQAYRELVARWSSKDTEAYIYSEGPAHSKVLSSDITSTTTKEFYASSTVFMRGIAVPNGDLGHAIALMLQSKTEYVGDYHTTSPHISFIKFLDPTTARILIRVEGVKK